MTLKAGELNEMLVNAQKILAGWLDYCNRNWLNDYAEDVYSPEMRVKRFLDSIGYYLLYGQMDDVTTAYKEVVGRAREIPVSSCPSSVSNLFYAGGGSTGDTATEEELSFRTMTELLDEKVPARKKPPARNQKAISRRERMEQIRKENGGDEIQWYRVDTDGRFSDGAEDYQMTGLKQYQPKTVRYRNGTEDILYDMDRVIRCGENWYDQKGDPIPDGYILKCGGIVKDYL